MQMTTTAGGSGSGQSSIRFVFSMVVTDVTPEGLIKIDEGVEDLDILRSVATIESNVTVRGPGQPTMEQAMTGEIRLTSR